MKLRLVDTLTLGLILFGLLGCATTGKRPALVEELQTPDVEPAVLTKVEKRQPLALADIEHLVARGVPDNSILTYLRQRRTVYRLKLADIDRLREAKVSDKLIEYLLGTPAEYQSGRRHYYPYYPFYTHSVFFHHAHCPPVHHHGFYHRCRP
jgi:hypothetical protein